VFQPRNKDLVSIIVRSPVQCQAGLLPGFLANEGFFAYFRVYKQQNWVSIEAQSPGDEMIRDQRIAERKIT